MTDYNTVEFTVKEMILPTDALPGTVVLVQYATDPGGVPLSNYFDAQDQSMVLTASGLQVNFLGLIAWWVKDTGPVKVVLTLSEDYECPTRADFTRLEISETIEVGPVS